MKKLLSIAIICCLGLATIQAQHHPHHKKGGDHLEKLKTELQLSDEQVSKLEKEFKALKEEMKNLRHSEMSREEMKAKFEELGERKEAIFEKVLTEEQNAKFEQMMQERMLKKDEMAKERIEMHKKRMEDKKPMHDELKAYHQKNIAPFMAAKRAALDKIMKKKDRKKADELREKAQEMKEEMKEKHIERREQFEKGNFDKKPHDKMKGPHHGHHKKGKDMRFMKQMMMKYEEEYKEALEVSNKYAKDIDKLMAEIGTQKEKWGEDMKAIKEKYISQEEMEEHKERMKAKKGACCKEGQKPGCCKGGAKSGCSKENAGACKKGEGAEKKSDMKENLKRIGFLLMPSKVIVEEEKEIARKTEPSPQITAKVFPNPSGNSNTLEFNIQEAGKYKIELFSKNGSRVKLIANEKLSEGTQRYDIDLSSLPTGSYYYVISNNKQRITQQFVKN